MTTTFFRMRLSKTKTSIWLMDFLHNLKIKFEFYPDNIVVKVVKDGKLIGFARIGPEIRIKLAKLIERYDGSIPIPEFFEIIGGEFEKRLFGE